MKTNKESKKPAVLRTYNVAVVTALANKYGYSETYIRRCLRGDADGLMPDEIRKDYKTLDEKMTTLLNG